MGLNGLKKKKGNDSIEEIHIYDKEHDPNKHKKSTNTKKKSKKN